MLRKILIADDSSANRILLKKVLESDYEIIQAKDGAEALSILRQTGFDCSAVLLDLAMPVIDGFEVLSEIRHDPELVAIPVIIITVDDNPSSEERALAMGANDYIVKPFRPAIIRNRLSNTIKLRETAALANSARRDKLTGLYSRDGFFEKAGELIAAHEAGYYTMACCDIDNFKVINDLYGTKKGDEILVNIANILREDIEAVGGICCREMADNFALLYPRHKISKEKLAEIRHRASRQDGSIQAMTFSIGRYIIDDLSLSVSAMYDRAIMAENTVGGQYDVQVVEYDESLRMQLLREQRIVSEMYTALNEGQFEVWFQPQYNHNSGAVVGAEALIRWRHPENGLLIPPGEFIPVFEKNGFVYELDKFVWKTACRYIRQWLDQGREVPPISVNISRYDILREDFFETVTGYVSRYNVPVNLLRLEITESAFAEASHRLIAMVQRLVDFGFTVEIDDFGSGYSSLNTLKDVPATVVKLDMRFLDNKGNRSRGGYILEAVVRMTKWLGMSVIAEGVETIEQADYLKSIGCYYVQGYFYAKPMPVNEYLSIAAKAKKEPKLLELVNISTLDNEAFWDPNSMDTLIFNSYVGGASVFEFYKGKVEILRVNDKYVKALGGDGMTPEQAIETRWENYMAEDDVKKLFDVVDRAIESGNEITDVMPLVGLRGEGVTTYLRSHLRLIARIGDRYLFYCMLEDITEKEEAERGLRESDAQLRFLNETAHGLLAQPDAEKGIEQALEKLMEYFDGRRAYIFELDDKMQTADNTYEVCGKEAKSEKDKLVAVPYSVLGFWLREFNDKNCISIVNVDSIGDEWAVGKDYLQKRHTRSLIAVSLRRDGRLIGFMGIDDPCIHQKRVERLEAIGVYMAVMLTRRDLNAKIANDNRYMKNLMNDTPGGLATYVCSPNNWSISYFNDGFCHIAGYDRDEYTKLVSEKGIMFQLLEQDLPVLREQLASLLTDGSPIDAVFRICMPDGGIKWVNLRGIPAEKTGDFVTINTVLFDITSRKLNEDRLRISEEQYRLALLHSGSVIFRYDPVTKSATTESDRQGWQKLLTINENLPQSVIEQGVVLPESENDYRRLFDEMNAGKESGSGKIHMLTDDGSPRWVEMKFSSVFSDDQTTSTAVVSYTDITENHEKELAYERYLQTARENAVSSSVLVYFEADITTDAAEKRGGFILPAVTLSTELTRKEIINYFVGTYVVDDEKSKCGKFFSREHLVTVFSDGVRNLTGDWSIIMPDGRQGFARSEIQMIQDPYTGHIKGYTTIRDITDEKAAAIEAQKLAQLDGMTGIYNKAATEGLIRQRLGRNDGSEYTLLVADLDNLKTINDTLGHPQGDRAIKQVAAVLSTQFRHTDIVGRIGGDEFIIFLENVGEKTDVDSIFHSLTEKISGIRIGAADDVPVYLSIGAAIGKAGVDQFEDMYEKADKALYEAKRDPQRQYSIYDIQ